MQRNSFVLKKLNGANYTPNAFRKYYVKNKHIFHEMFQVKENKIACSTFGDELFHPEALSAIYNIILSAKNEVLKSRSEKGLLSTLSPHEESFLEVKDIESFKRYLKDSKILTLADFYSETARLINTKADIEKVLDIYHVEANIFSDYQRKDDSCSSVVTNTVSSFSNITATEISPNALSQQRSSLAQHQPSSYISTGSNKKVTLYRLNYAKYEANENRRFFIIDKSNRVFIAEKWSCEDEQNPFKFVWKQSQIELFSKDVIDTILNDLEILNFNDIKIPGGITNFEYLCSFLKEKDIIDDKIIAAWEELIKKTQAYLAEFPHVERKEEEVFLEEVVAPPVKRAMLDKQTPLFLYPNNIICAANTQQNPNQFFPIEPQRQASHLPPFSSQQYALNDSISKFGVNTLVAPNREICRQQKDENGNIFISKRLDLS